jgi:actin-like ATPase involved in cell morphogenesis
MGYHLGVDLGTTYTAAARARGTRAEVVALGTRSVSVPSVVYLGTAGNELLIGEAAARRAAMEPQRVAREFKRRVGDPTPLLLGGSPVGAELIMARVLEWVVARVSETEGEAPQSLAVTHPANWGRYKLDLLSQAIRHVDLRADHLVPEPAAAAAFYASQRDLAPGSVVAVYDLGGGTFDAAVVRVDDDGFHLVGKPDGIERMGGIDFDHAVLSHVAAALDVDLDDHDSSDPSVAAALVQLRQDCVEAKEALSSDTEVSVPVMLPTRHTEVRLTRVDFETMIRPALNETVVALRRAVASADVAVGDLSAVLLVGGSSRIPLVAELVGEELGRPIAIDARPKDAISMGAALLAAQKADASSPPGAATAATAIAGAAAAGAAAAAVGVATANNGAQTPAAQASATPAPTAGEARAPLPPPPAGRPAGAITPSGPVTYAGPQVQPPASAANGSNDSTRLYLIAVAAVAAVALVVVLIAAVQGGGGGDDDDQATPGGPSQATTTLPPDDATTTTEDPTGGTGAFDPLPGDDWNDEARTQFESACTTGVATQVGLSGDDANGMCLCIYDTSKGSGMSFDDFNAGWTSTDLDATPAGTEIVEIMTTCTLEVFDGV